MSNNTQDKKDSSNTDMEDPKSEMEDAIESEEEKRMAMKRNNRMKKIIVGTLLLAFVVYVIVDSLTTGYIRSGVKTFLEWIEANPVPGFFVFMVVYLIATVLFIPGSILTLGAGFVFANAFGLGAGVLLGTLSVFFGASAGGIIAFLLGRYLFRDWVIGLAKKYTIFEALDAALEEKGFRIMTLLRLSPIIPFNAINYIAGVTAISLRAYVLAMFAILPGTVLYIFLGASAGSLTDSANSGSGNITVTIIVIAVGVVFGIASIVATSYYAKKELNRIVEARQTTINEDAGGSQMYDNVMIEDLEDQLDINIETKEESKSTEDEDAYSLSC